LGIEEAQFNVAQYLRKGQGVLQDFSEALKWYRISAEKGFASSQFQLGVFYREGELGLLQDYVVAANWFRRAAEQNHTDAQTSLALAHLVGWGVPEDLVQAHMWANLAGSKALDENARVKASEIREYIADQMTREQIADAQQLAREWQPTPRNFRMRLP
jgi:uncharacterized protein